MLDHIVCPIPPPCSNYVGARKRRCPETATHWLVHPDGELNPGGHVCETHGNKIIAEFAEKIEEEWSLVPIVREAPAGDKK